MIMGSIANLEYNPVGYATCGVFYGPSFSPRYKVYVFLNFGILRKARAGCHTLKMSVRDHVTGEAGALQPLCTVAFQ